MKKLYFLLCLVMTTVAGFGQLVYEPFNYTPDPTLGLATQSGNGTVWKTTNSGDSILVDANSLSYTSLAPSTGNKVKFDGAGTDYFRSFTNQTAGTVYASFLLNLSSLGGLNATGGYFFALTDGSSSSNHASTVWVRLSGTGYNIGVNSRTTAANTAWLSPTLNTGTTYLVVVSYTIVAGATNDYASIWLNPVTLGGAAPPADAVAVVATADLTNVGRVQLRQDATAATPFVQFDELRIGTDYATVTPVDPAFTTPTVNVSALPSFGSICVNTTGGPNSFNIGGSNLTAADLTVGPLAGYTFSTTSGGTYTSSLTLTHAAGSYFQTVYVKFTPTSVQSYNGNIPVSGGGAAATNVAAVGAGINAPVVTTGASSAITTSGATLAGTINNIGCSAVTAYGIEYSTTNNFTPGTGTQVTSSNLASNAYTSVVTGLNPGVTYYYVAYATNASGTGYGTQSSFTTAVPPAPSQAPVATAATAVGTNGFTANWNSVSDATNYRLDVFTQAAATQTNTIIAGWNGTSQYIPKYADTGTVYNVVNIDSFTTTATNSITNANGPSGGVGTTPNPFAIQATGWDAGQDTKYWETQVNTTGATSLTISSLQGSSSTGPANFKVQYKIGAGGTYTDIPGATVTLTTAVQAGTLATWGAISNIAIPAAAENQPSVYFRWIMTNNTAVNGSAVAATGTSRIAAVYIKGNYTGTVRTYVPGFQNLSTGNVTTYNVTGLDPATTYYYVVRAENAGGYSQNSNTITVTTTAAATASLTTNTLAGFGNVCIGQTSAEQTLTLTGTNLTAGNLFVTPPAGYKVSATSGGPYQFGTLTISQAGGAYSGNVYVQFAPSAAQPYNGNIVITGGGLASPVNAAVTGTGVNTLATVVTGSASAITASSATAAGSISATGCGAITAYGIEYSTTNNFTPGTGTQVASANLSAGAFSSALSGLAASTTYYYIAYATNSAGTAYGAQQQFTTTAAPSMSASTLAAFGATCINTTAGPNSFTITGSNLSTSNVVVGALAGYTYSLTAGGTYTSTLTITQPGGAFSQQVFVKFTPTAVQTYGGNIAITGGGASTVLVAVSNDGINTAPSVTTGAASGVTTSAATLNGIIGSTGCSAISAYGISYSTTPGFAPATGTIVNGTNLSGGAFSVSLSGLTPNTTYYYVVFATNAGGTTYGTQSSFSTSTNPALSASALGAFGNVCLNTASTANSFTITGSNLTNANVNVGPLAGYTFATTSGGTYTSSLSLAQAGGSYSQAIFVKLTPTTVQSYNGNIPVSGGGFVTTVDVAATGAGINTAPTVTTAAATGIGASTATIPGTISSTGCSAVTAYGTIWSTINGFNPATQGTTVAGANLSAGNFSVALSGLTPGTTYYYVTYATNAGGTSYSAQQSFATLNPSLSASALTAFGNVCLNTASAANSFTITGSNLSAANITVGPLAGYSFSTTSGGTYTTSLSLAQAGGSYSQAIFVKLTPTSVQSYSGNIPVSGGGFATTVNVAASGAGVNTLAGLNTDAVTAITTTSATANAEVFSNGCSAATAYGFVYSTVNGFNPATSGTTVTASNLSGGIFSANISGLAPATTYYVVAFSTNNGGTAYASNQQTFTTTSAVAAPAAPVATAATAITSTGFTANWNAVTGATGYFLDVYTLGAGSGTSTIAGWDMAGTTDANRTANVGNAANNGIATLTATNGGTPTYSYPAGPSAIGGTNPQSVSTSGWDAGVDTKYWMVGVNTTGATGLKLSSLQGGSNTGPRDWKIQYRVGSSGTWIDVTGGTIAITTPPVAANPATFFGVTDLALPAAAENQPLVQIRWVVTSTVSVNNTVVASGGTNRITAIYVKSSSGASVPVYVTGYQNLSVGNVTSANVTGLTAGTTYYYVVRATNAGGTSANSNQITVTTTAAVTPALTATALTAFGNTCINTTSAANSFTINGTNLSTANVTVGPLAGYAFSTTAGGTYTPTLTLTQTGGTYSQQVFVQLTPTAAQSYSGNIPVAGGGATAINVAASGTGVNSAPTVTAGAATSVTGTSATLPGTITSTGCSAVTAYGIVWSTVSGFDPATAGTTIPGTNLASNAFSVNLGGLTAGTTYYFVTYATNAGGTSYSTQQTFTATAGGTPPAAPVATAATAVTSTGFTANWNAVTGATGYFLDVYTLGAGSGTSTIAGWDMAGTTDANRTANVGNAANNGIATLTATNGGTPTYSYPAGPSAIGGTNPQSVSTSGWDAGVDTKYWMVGVNTTGATGLKLSSLQGGSNTGPRDWKIQYRVGSSGTWIDVTGGTIAITTPPVAANPATFFGVTDLALPAAAENQPLVQIRWVVASTVSVNNTVVASGGTNRITAIYVKSSSGASVPVYVTGYQNLSVGNVTSANVTGLTPNTTYYYVVRAANAAGTSGNSNEIMVATPVSVSPTITATTLASFGNVCPNTTTAASSFTLSGTNLTNANVTVGPLAGYAFSTTAGGTYTPSLTLTQAGGTYSQQVFVQFTPTTVQSYNGNIPVTGGGTSTTVNVAATGAGVNNAPSVTTGAATAVTNTTATLAGTITNNGCTAVTAYGIEWSQTPGFANGTGTAVASTNAVAGAFTSALTGLTAGTTYYYHAYATNGAGTSYGAQQSFATAAGPVVSLTATTLTNFGDVCVGTTSAPASFTISGTNLNTTPVTVAALNGYSYATTATGTYTPTLTLTQAGGTYTQQVFVQLSPTAAQAYNGNIAISGGGSAATINVNATGNGVVTPPTAVTADSLNIVFDGVTLRGSVGASGCSPIIEAGIEYSGIPNFTAGTGTRVAATGVPASTFAVTLSNLVPGTTYYYRAYARNAGATGYGAVKSVTLPSLSTNVLVFPQPVANGQTLRVTVNGVQPGNYAVRIYSRTGEEVLHHFFNVQSTFINERVSIPAALAAGVYVLRVTSNTEVVAHQTIVIMH